MTLIAALPMYDWPAARAAHDRLWAAIRDRLREGGIDAPEALDRGIGLMAGWCAPDLLLGQTCGLPFRTSLKGRVTLVGTFDHDLPATPPGHYRSHLIARADDARPLARLASRLAFNADDSQSGWAAPWSHLARRGIDARPVRRSGSHRASALAVAAGDADLAAIDAVTWRHFVAAEPEAAGRLRIVDSTAPAPALPLITALGRDPLPIRAALALALGDLAPEDRATLGIAGLVDVPASAYFALPVPPAPVLADPA